MRLKLLSPAQKVNVYVAPSPTVALFGAPHVEVEVGSHDGSSAVIGDRETIAVDPEDRTVGDNAGVYSYRAVMAVTTGSTLGVFTHVVGSGI